LNFVKFIFRSCAIRSNSEAEPARQRSRRLTRVAVRESLA
jgi:hypothetical protein